MKIKTLSVAAPAYSYPGNPVQPFGMLGNLRFLLKVQEKIQKEFIQLNEETNELIQALTDRDQVDHAKKICLDPKICLLYSVIH